MLQSQSWRVLLFFFPLPSFSLFGGTVRVFKSSRPWPSLLTNLSLTHSCLSPPPRSALHLTFMDRCNRPCETSGMSWDGLDGCDEYSGRGSCYLQATAYIQIAVHVYISTCECISAASPAHLSMLRLYLANTEMKAVQTRRVDVVVLHTRLTQSDAQSEANATLADSKLASP
ncbi:hypothetical protein F5Y17DRAFT_208849 [Xylariaceae sp. FL0594]|nr:hypothetical protein F5Y17DRAFT_208849 [Xylariaceae sp. FL0594]